MTHQGVSTLPGTSALTGVPPCASRMCFVVRRLVPPLANATSTVCLSTSLALPSAETQVMLKRQHIPGLHAGAITYMHDRVVLRRHVLTYSLATSILQKLVVYLIEACDLPGL